MKKSLITILTAALLLGTLSPAAYGQPVAGEAAQSDVVQSDVVQSDVVQSEAVQSDVVQREGALQEEPLQAAAPIREEAVAEAVVSEYVEDAGDQENDQETEKRIPYLTADGKALENKQKFTVLTGWEMELVLKDDDGFLAPLPGPAKDSAGQDSDGDSATGAGQDSDGDSAADAGQDSNTDPVDAPLAEPTQPRLEWTSSKPEVVSLETDDDDMCIAWICAEAKGSSAITVTGYCWDEEKQQEVKAFSWKITITVYEHPLASWDETQKVLTKGAAKTFKVTNPKGLQEYTWSSSNSKIAKVDETGLVTAVKYGTATITVAGTDLEGDPFSASVDILVSDAVSATDQVIFNIAPYTENYGLPSFRVKKLQPISSVKLSVTDSKGAASKDLKVSYSRNGDNAITVYATGCLKAGSYIILVKVDGKEIPVKARAINTCFKRNSKSVGDRKNANVVDITILSLYKGEKTTLKMTGLPKGVSVKWSSGDKRVATVSAAGLVTAKGIGKTSIEAKITVDGTDFSFHYPVAVAPKKSVLALRSLESWFPLKYSQPRRMWAGYADCSSFVWRALKQQGINYGSKTYAPVAAEEAKWSVQRGHVMQYGTVASGQIDLEGILPGDIIYWCGYNNGRYMGIYHVEMYEGNHYAITVASLHEYLQSDYVSHKTLLVTRPTGTAVTVKGTAGVGQSTLSWSKQFGAKGYVVYRSSKKNGLYQKVATVKTNSYTDTGLKKGKRYYYKVRPYWKSSKRYYGNPSNLVCVKTKKR